MKLILLHVLLACSFLATQAQTTISINWVQKNSQPPEQVILYDKKVKLTWADFKGKPNLPNPTVAITSSGFGYDMGIQTKNDKATIKLFIYCSFDKQQSWVKPGQNTPYILEHEQHHFDATFIASQEFIKKIRTANLTPQNATKVLADLYKQCFDSMNKMQNDYDNQTQNGLVKAKQAEWSAFFKKKLTEYE